MTFLLRLRKGDLLEVARELGVEVNDDLTKVETKDMVLQNDKNDIETIKAVMEGILEEKERKFEERRRFIEYDLELLRLSNATETVSVSSADLEGQGVGFTTYRVAPVESTELIAKEPPDKIDDYPHIKKLILNRFQLTPVALRDRKLVDRNGNKRFEGVKKELLVSEQLSRKARPFRSKILNFRELRKLEVVKGNGIDHSIEQKPIIYYYHNEVGHIKPACPKLMKTDFGTVASLRVISEDEDCLKNLRLNMK
ncbi:uncharacterized protein TNCV_2366821 [Trichonephila clavipes]|nr:uncharacterized protein TNCV_2366821 [Trichonephila clavipes]